MRRNGSRAAYRHNRDLFVTLVERQFRLRSKRAFIAGIWPLLAPLVLLALYAFVFDSIFTVDIPRYAEFVFAGLLPWSLVAQGLGAASSSLASEEDLIRRTRFPYEYLPMSVVACLSVFFVIDLCGFIVYLALASDVRVILLPLLVVPIVALVLLTMSLAAVISLIDIYNRDVRVLLGNALTVWFFLVPVLYSHEMAGERLRFLRSVDPMNMIVGQFRDLLYYGHVSRPSRMAAMLVVCIAFSAASLATFRRFSPRLPRDV